MNLREWTIYVLFCLLAFLILSHIFSWGMNSVSLRTIVFTLLCIFHARGALGGRNTLVFFTATVLISWAYEQLGVMTGLIYGEYHYSDQLGFKLGHVPLLIPFSWFIMIYPSHVMANAIATGRCFSPPEGRLGGWGALFWLSFLAAMIMTSWDVVMDPEMSAAGFWVWENGGAYFGVPLQNYFGWMLTTFSVYTVYRILERVHVVRSDFEQSLLMKLIPVLCFLMVMLVQVTGTGIPELRLTGLFVMGFPVVFAMSRIIGDHNGTG